MMQVDKTEQEKMKQRNVNSRLGKNITRDHEEIYNEIEKKVGPTKSCNFGFKKGSKTGVKHEGEQILPIQNFELRNAYKKENGEITIKGDGLQGFCRDCSKRRRRVRLETSRAENVGGYDTYKTKYGKETYECSICKIEKTIEENFKLSPGMECGLHNICNNCSKTYGQSVGDRWIIYRPDGSFKYKKMEANQHDDHIFPLALGGSNEEINHQLLSAKENLQKSSAIHFNDIMDISPLLLSERWRSILVECQESNVEMHILESRLRKAIRDEQEVLYKDELKLKSAFEDYNKQLNLRRNVKRAIEKFRDYCTKVLKL
jgi:hypothetical protein